MFPWRENTKCVMSDSLEMPVSDRVMNYMLIVLTTTVNTGMKVANSLSELVRK